MPYFVYFSFVFNFTKQIRVKQSASPFKAWPKYSLIVIQLFYSTHIVKGGNCIIDFSLQRFGIIYM